MSDVFRNVPVTEEQAKLIFHIKEKAVELLDLFPVASDGRLISREFSIAQTKLEEAVMWAVKGVSHRDLRAEKAESIAVMESFVNSN